MIDVQALDVQPLWLTLKLATITTVVLVIIGIPLARWLAFGRSRIRPVIETLCTLPLVLPPTVLGFYLLISFSPVSFTGRWLEDALGLRLVFTFSGLVIGSVLFSLPFMLQPLVSGFRQLPANLIDAARTLGKTETTILTRVILPNTRAGLLSGIVLAFAHTVGEFGVVLMLGGGVTGDTKVASIALYQRVEALDYAGAHSYALVLVSFAFAVLLLLRLIQSRHEARQC
ncbi:molybdenum ABC transporter permease subunit [Jeongeupia sp. HS-3]|uniref:molybdate ABC transporter permease subunit n=1 Tax=Jeongeupia sp. HS-3 TaxID=1009682 RepID=UPI0018A3B30B|nr:molybdate ABC transporter permease subunit [Jeongeupia sp. HS-3]BCL75776.1 molybdenum ABC transporter permease subunit [Jeongeupia sp. HS-3]